MPLQRVLLLIAGWFRQFLTGLVQNLTLRSDCNLILNPSLRWRVCYPIHHDCIDQLIPMKASDKANKQICSAKKPHIAHLCTHCVNYLKQNAVFCFNGFSVHQGQHHWSKGWLKLSVDWRYYFIWSFIKFSNLKTWPLGLSSILTEEKEIPQDY